MLKVRVMGTRKDIRQLIVAFRIQSWIGFDFPHKR